MPGAIRRRVHTQRTALNAPVLKRGQITELNVNGSRQKARIEKTAFYTGSGEDAHHVIAFTTPTGKYIGEITRKGIMPVPADARQIARKEMLDLLQKGFNFI